MQLENESSVILCFITEHTTTQHVLTVFEHGVCHVKINQSGTTSEYFDPLQTYNTRHTLTHFAWKQEEEKILILTLTRADVGFELSLILQSEQIC